MTPSRTTRTLLASIVLLLLLAPGLPGQVPTTPSPADVEAAIDLLGSLDDYSIRMNAARTVRRTDPDVAVPALTRAVRSHQDEYVRYRALVLLAGFGRPATTSLMRGLMTDRNDRIRTVVFGWFEHHPDEVVVPALIDALARERSEFVRPALTRALAAHGHDSRARDVLAPLVLRGEDFFRGAVIEALGDFRAAYALPNIVAVAELDGPLQDDAITALGKIGDPSLRPTLASLQREAPRELQPTLSASLCLLGFDCETHEAFVDDSLAFAAATEGINRCCAGPCMRRACWPRGVAPTLSRRCSIRVCRLATRLVRRSRWASVWWRFEIPVSCSGCSSLARTARPSSACCSTPSTC
jgi:hypothetical protein